MPTISRGGEPRRTVGTGNSKPNVLGADTFGLRGKSYETRSLSKDFRRETLSPTPLVTLREKSYETRDALKASSCLGSRRRRPSRELVKSHETRSTGDSLIGMISAVRFSPGTRRAPVPVLQRSTSHAENPL
jgi:hypothetical protein